MDMKERCHMNTQEQDRTAIEAAYRRGWTQGVEEIALMVGALMEMGYRPIQIRRLLAAYQDHFLARWREDGDLTRREPPPEFEIHILLEIVKQGGYDQMI